MGRAYAHCAYPSSFKHLDPHSLDSRYGMSASEQSNVGNFGSDTSSLYGVIDKYK